MRCSLIGALAVIVGLSLAATASAQEITPPAATQVEAAIEGEVEAALPEADVQGQGEGQLDPTLNEGAAQTQPGLRGQTQSGLETQTELGVDADAQALGVDATGEANAAAQRSATANDRNAKWRFVRHNGEWWYWTPENTWMYHRDNQWSTYNPDTYVRVVPQGRRYATGYRGYVDDGGGYYYDSYGRRYFNDGGATYYDPYGRRAYQNRVYNDGSFYNGGTYDGGRVYDGRVYDQRLNNPSFRRGANLGGAIGDAIGGDVGGAIGAEIGGAIGD